MTTVQRLFARRWRVPAASFRVRASDGVEIAGARLGDASPERPALVLAHGLFGWHRKPRVARFAEDLTRWFTVYGMDLRGHGGSGGTCTYGCSEIEDVDAVVRLARDRRHATIATLGTSMGAIAVVRHAALRGGVDHVVTISSPAGWGPDDAGSAAHAAAWRRLRGVVATRPGRRLARAFGVRLPSAWEALESAGEVAGSVAPTPLLVVHGADDHLFALDEAMRLFEAAREPKGLLVASRFGHAEDGFSPALARRLARAVYQGWGRPWPA
jgi:pimeloyl-ACP methyl ester carboxylesterase